MKTRRPLFLFAASLFAATTSFAQTLTVTNDLALWLRADAGVTTNASGGVIQWADQSTNANNAAQITDAAAPLLINGALTGRPVLRFDGADDFLNVPDADSISFTGDLTTLFVVKIDDFDWYRAIWGKTAGALGNYPAPTDIYVPQGANFMRAFRGDSTPENVSSVDSGPLRANTYLVLGLDVQGTTLTHYLNNQANGSGIVTLNTADGNTDLKIGSRQDGVTRMKGDIAELLIYGRALSTTERSNAFNYLQVKYGLTNLAPSVTLSSTPAGPNVNVGEVVRINANAIDLDGTIARVEFFANGLAVGTATAMPFSASVRMDSAGSVTFTARAVDDKGLATTSAPLVLTAGPVSTPSLEVLDGLQLWLAADTGTALGAGDTVLQWADQSGNANNAEQINETMAPVLVPDALNGKPVVRFDGANDFLDVADSDSVSITGDISTFYVTRFANFSGFRAIWSKGIANQPAPNDLFAANGTGLPRFLRGNGSASTGVNGTRPYPANTFILAGVQAGGATVTHYLGGLANNAGNITAAIADGDTPLKIGVRADGGTRLSGDIAELVIYNRALPAAERRALEIYLTEKYGLPALFTPANAGPVVAVTSPTGVIQAGTVNVSVDATDADGSVTAVRIFVNGVLRAIDTSAPYSTTVDIPYGGHLVLSATAFDNLGASRTSPSVTVCVQGPNAPAGLVGYWPLDGNADARLGPDGVLVNNPVPADDRNGIPGGALFFGGTNFVEIFGGGGLAGAARGTVSMWVKWIGTQDAGFDGSFGAVLGRQQDGIFSADIISLNNADPAVAIVQWRHNAFGVRIAGTTPVGNEMWRHIAVTFSPTNSALYVNNVLEGTNTGGTLPANPLTPLVIGAWTGAGASFATASVDDVAIWNRVLTPGEIESLVFQTSPLDLMLQPDCLIINASGGLVVRWGSDSVLQCASELTGPWDDLTSATSPYPVPAGPTQKFYRLRSR